MAATYQSNFNKVLKSMSLKDFSKWNFDPRAYPYHEQEFVHNSLWHGFDPWKDSYSSPLCHINLYQVTVPEQINSLSTLLVRDGLFTWIDFLNRCPNPKKIPGIFLLHRCLKDYVPSAWRSKIVFYDYEYRKSPHMIFQKKNSNIIIKANVTDHMFDYDQAAKKVLELKKKNYEKFLFVFLRRSNPFLVKEWDNDYKNNEFVASQSKFQLFLEKEKIDYSMLTWREYFHIQGMHQFDILDLNFKEKYYIDDFTNYFFLKKGVGPYEALTLKGDKADHYVPLSAFHGIRILSREPSYNTKKVDEIFRNLKMMNLLEQKCDVGAFFMINEVSDKKLEPVWPKFFV